MPLPADQVVFVGPSLEREAVARALPAALVEPPIARGDLARLHAQGATTFLILDGVFVHRPAVAPSEIVDAIAGGAHVTGAASLGAIRAAECWPAGMEGVGAVYRLYRLGVLRDDDEVAVATDPERRFAAVSVALVSVRYAALAGLRAGLLDRAQAAAMVTSARGIHFPDRRWETIWDRAGLAPGEDLIALCQQTDVKRRDAIGAVAHLAQARPALGPGVRREPNSQRNRHGRRLRGHDPRFGHSPAELRHELASWLVASGRYRRYFGAAPPTTIDREAFETTVWAKLEAEGALEGELMRWYAVQRLAPNLGPLTSMPSRAALGFTNR